MLKQELFILAKQIAATEIEGINRVINNLDDSFFAITNEILTCSGKIIVTGIGKSGHIANKLAATFASTGTPSFFLHPAEAIHGDLGMISNNDLIIAISYSGEAEEIVNILPTLKHKNITIIAFSSNKYSTLAKSAKYMLDIKINKEACPLNLAPTTSTTATLVLGDILAICLLTMRGFNKEDFAISHPGGMLGRRLLTLVKDLMHTGYAIPKVFLDTKLKDIIIEITKKALGFTAVVDSNDILLGIITDGDLRRAIEKNSPYDIQAQEIMSTLPKTFKENDLALDAVDIMKEYQITGFLVVDNTNKLIGTFNVHSLFKAKLI